MAQQPRGRRCSAVVGSAAAALGATLVGLAGAAQADAAAPPKCTVQFTTSDSSPVVGENITLRWTTSGADELVASWTSANVPFTGSQVTTKNTPGPASYQVTGLKSGQYCGGAVVSVVFTVAKATSSASSAPATTPASSTPASSASAPPTLSSSVVSATSSVLPTSASPSASASSSATYPAQSPTGGSSTPWYEQPLNLLVVGLLCLFGSVALFQRDRMRALLVRRH